MHYPSPCLRSLLFTLSLSLAFICKAEARPEYALGVKNVSCTACHTSPAGGGIRNANGKYYGAHGRKLSNFSHQIFQFDYRVEAFQAKNKYSRKGLFTMTAIPSADIPIQTGDDKLPTMNLVASYGLGRLDTGLGYTYLRYNLNQEHRGIEAFEHVVLGRFNPPFGLATDDHRIFTKISSRSSSRDYETGFMLSGTPSHYFHYDLAATNGLQGDTPAVDDSPWALYLNARTIPYLGPVMLGLSYSSHGTNKVQVKPEAASLYALFDIKRIWTSVPLLFTVEVQTAKGWNHSSVNSGMSNFIPGSFTTWQEALADSESRTLLFETNYEFHRHLIGLYRFEEFTPDTRYTGDQFLRHSFGLKYFINAHSNLIIRYERGYSTRPGVNEDGSVRSIGKTAFALLHFWL